LDYNIPIHVALQISHLGLCANAFDILHDYILAIYSLGAERKEATWPFKSLSHRAKVPLEVNFFMSETSAITAVGVDFIPRSSMDEA